jgi:hypothetical protein
MSIEQRIQAFVQLGEALQEKSSERLHNLYESAEIRNRWFTQAHSRLAVEGIGLFLVENKLRTWLQKYKLPTTVPRKIGVIMAGNIPLVGFHDMMCVLLSGHILYAKPSSDDEVLMKGIVEILVEIEPAFASQVQWTEHLKGAEAYIATGSDNSARYFEYYFRDTPNIIRQNRVSVAVLHGQETAADFAELGKDVFSYFGLGCRNIAKLFVPEGYHFNEMLKAFEAWNSLIMHHKYANNYEYQRAVLLVNQILHWDNGVILLRETQDLASPTGVLYFETYRNEAELRQVIAKQKDKIQVIASQKGWLSDSIPFGEAQCPQIEDYADGVDTMAFLAGL